MRVISGLVLTVSVAAAAGCGSSGPAGAVTSGATTRSTPPFRYARCMRSHGVTNFPDPQVTVRPGSTSVRQVVPASLGSSPRFKSAEHACNGIIATATATPDHQGPGAGVLLAFARCLRSHGMSDFPDPDRTGQISRAMLSAAGVNVHTPVFLSAATACIGVTRGAITPADLRSAISGPH